ncbi:MAG TPA: dihydroxyacetone kinase phosphoryl donor subunit DhaM [Ktedonobacterales bacterium]|nr:dihydroxyacetone kinase phosphoryl donor subunit DhaM [Ktedonobacterales bacterium]
MAVSLVIVSHSVKLAEGVAELAAQMANGQTIIATAGGAADGSLGTSADKVLQALTQAASIDGILILVDLGSAAMAVDIALESLTPEQRARVQVSSAPLVEGAVIAAVEASIGRSLAEVAEAATSAEALNKFPGER